MPQTWGSTLARQIRLQKRSIALTHADLTTAGAIQVIDIGDALPATAVILAASLALTVVFASPGAGSLEIEVGDDTNDDNSIVAAFDAYTGSGNLGLTSRGDTVGIAPSGNPSGLQLALTLTATTDNLSTFTTGACQIDVWFLEAVNPE